ncbi:MAG TPA: DUF4350 domain-containing protein [Chloroflexota bacterium]|jgi:hypothetical protein
MSVSPSRLGFVGLVAALVMVTALLVRPTTSLDPPLTVRSAEPSGARALLLWLEALGYAVEEIDADPYTVGPEVRTLFILAPVVPFEDDALDTLARWVEQGGRLVLVAGGSGRALLQHFGLHGRFAGDRLPEAVPAQPLLLQPPVERLRVDAWETVESDSGLAPWLVADDRVVLGSHPYGQGEVIVLTALRPLTNEALKEPASADLVLNLVGRMPAGARVAFDEYHHGFVRGRGARGLWELLVAHYWGWGVIYAVALAYLYLWLRGRRFGPPLAAPAGARRSVSEYVASLGALYRRAGQRGYVADRLADQLKHDLATGLGLNARLPDDTFAEAVAERRRTAAAPLRDALTRLRAGGRLAERDLLALVRESDALKARLLRHGA